MAFHLDERQIYRGRLEYERVRAAELGELEDARAERDAARVARDAERMARDAAEAARGAAEAARDAALAEVAALRARLGPEKA